MQAVGLFDMFLSLALIALVCSAFYLKKKKKKTKTQVFLNHEMCLRSTKCMTEESVETG